MDMPIIDRVFGMESGYVLNFTNRTFAEFFHEELGVDIYEDRWAAQGGSKAKRLRYYLRHAARQTALDTLNALWEYREATSVTADYPELGDSVHAAFFRIIARLGGTPPRSAVPISHRREQSIDVRYCKDCPRRGEKAQGRGFQIHMAPSSAEPKHGRRSGSCSRAGSPSPDRPA